MRQYSLVPGAVALPIAPAGPTLYIVNHPGLFPLDQSKTTPTALTGLPVPATVFVGFGSSPTPNNFDAVVPPFSQATIAVPPFVSTVYLYAAIIQDALMGQGNSLNAALVAVGWLATPLPAAIVPFTLPPLATGAVAGGGGGDLYVRPVAAVDQGGMVWLPTYEAPVLDQAGGQAAQDGFTYSPRLRPRIAPSAVDTIHKAVALNTLTTLIGGWDGGAGFLVVPSSIRLDAGPTRLLFRVKVAVSAACTVVIGGPQLTVGAPGAQEAGRLVFAAAGSDVLDYGPGGLDIRVFPPVAGAAPWQFYATAAVTVDATVLGG